MTPLWRKLWRDLKANWAQFLAVIIVITLGGGFFIGSFSARSGVEESLAKTYGDLNFPQYWVKLEGEGPPSLPTGVEMRETAQVSLEFNEGTRAGAVAIGLPGGGPVFNKLKVLKGALPGEGQVLVEVGFAKFHNLSLGDTVTVKNGDKVYNWVVAGIAGSAEYIWPVADRFVPNPSPRSFGVIYVPERQLIRDITGLNHELLVGGDIRDVMTFLQGQGTKVREVYSRSEQPSHQILQLMLNGFGKVTRVLPWLFLLAAALATYALTSVLVRAQTFQIRILWDLGFSRWQIVRHYLSFSFLAGLVGSLWGAALGILLARRLTGALVEMLGIPFTVSHVRTEVLLVAAVICCLAAILGGLSPALELRGNGETGVTRVPGWHRYLPVLLRMPLNNLRRDFKASMYGVIVVGLGVCLLVTGIVLYNSVLDSATKQFTKYQAYDLKVQFRGALKEDVSTEIANLPGVSEVSQVYELPVVIQKDKKQIPTLLVGIRGNMLSLEDRLGKPAQLNGLWLSEGVKAEIGASWTPEVTLTAQGGRKGEFPVKGYARWHMGNEIFAPLEMVQSLAGRKGITGAFLKVEPGEMEQVRAQLYKYPTVTLVDSPQENFADQASMMKFTYTYLRVLLVFGLLLSAAMIFATARVNTLTRSREYITMRVLGLGQGKIYLSVLGEYLIILLGGLVLGGVTGLGITNFLLAKVNNLLFYNVISLKLQTLLMVLLLAVLIIPGAVISAILAINKLDMAQNTREKI